MVLIDNSQANERTPLTSTVVVRSCAPEDLDVELEVTIRKDSDRKKDSVNRYLPYVFLSLGFVGMVLLIQNMSHVDIKERAAWSSRASPFSTVDPVSLGFISMPRSYNSLPGPIFGHLLDANLPLPTNTWYENLVLGNSYTSPVNRVFQVPYILDTAGKIQGVRTYPCHVQSNSRAVMVRNHSNYRSLNCS